MSEKELDSLKSLPVPPPRPDAKAAALAVAAAAFENSQIAAQAAAHAGRPTPRSQSETRSRKMTLTRSQYAMAASLAALIVAAPVAFRIALPPRPDAAAPLDVGRAGGSGTRDADAESTAATPATHSAEERRTETRKLKARSDAGRAAPTDPVAGPEPSPPPAPLDFPAAALGVVGAPSKPAQVGDGDRSASAPAARAVGAMGLGADRRERAIVPEPALPRADDGEDRNRFATADLNAVKQVASEPVSTFSIDVDTASYAYARRLLNAGRLPPKASVRAEEMINYFDYAYPAGESAAEPFKTTVTVVPSPWSADNKLVHIGIKGYELTSAERPRANLVLLVDVSGSMAPDDRLPLVRNALQMLVDELKPDDTVSIVTYASGSGVALEPTKIASKAAVLQAIDRLGAGGSTAGAKGIEDAYRLAEANFDKAAVNRIILATDGDFNVGLTDDEELKGLIERKRDQGIFLSILGVGEGNYNDRLMQKLAQNGNGVAAYADTLNEARKVLVEETSSTLFPIAKDVKIQVEWNPARIAAYRLIGYETRALRREDFNNDRVDAGDVGSGHTVTAIYEVTPVGAGTMPVDDLRYGSSKALPAEAGASDELGFLKMRFKLPDQDRSAATTVAITDALVRPKLDDAPADVRFATAVAGFAELLRGSPHVGTFGYDDVLRLAVPARGDDPFGQRSEFVSLVRLAKSARP